MRSETAGGASLTAPRRTIRRGGQATRTSFPTPLAGTSDLWGDLNWAWVYQAALRCARRIGSDQLDDLAHDIALATVVAWRQRPIRPGVRGRRPRPTPTELRAAINHAESVTEQRYTPRGFRAQNVVARFPGARLSPGDWRALYTWLSRVLRDGTGRRVLVLTLGGESIERAAELCGIALASAKVERSRALAACRRALERVR